MLPLGRAALGSACREQLCLGEIKVCPQTPGVFLTKRKGRGKGKPSAFAQALRRGSLNRQEPPPCPPRMLFVGGCMKGRKGIEGGKMNSVKCWAGRSQRKDSWEGLIMELKMLLFPSFPAHKVIKAAPPSEVLARAKRETAAGEEGVGD